MNIRVIKTDTMTKIEKEDICSLYKKVFGLVKTYEMFVHQFEKNEFGHSYFGLVYDDDKLIGSYAVMPLKFVYLGRDVVFGQSVDTMIDENYRGNPFLLKKLAGKIYAKLKEDSIYFVFGFPNDNIYLVRKKILKWKDIYNLDIYLLPINIDAIDKRLKYFNFLGNIFARVLNLIKRRRIDTKEKFKIMKHKSTEFNNYRFSKNYSKINLSQDTYSFYRIKSFGGINTAFIVDVFPLTKNNLEETVRQIYRLENNIDLIAYFGFLLFRPVNLFKIPNKIKPKNTFMAGKILDPDKINEDIFDILQWRVNLSDFDWI